MNHLSIEHRTKKKIILLAAILANASALVGQATVEENDRVPPNVILIVVDDLGWTDLACYGSTYYQSPNIDRLSQNGIRFTDAYASCTVCSPTRAALMSGKNPAKLRITDWIAGWHFPHAKLAVPDWTMFLDPENFTMPKAFKDAGYSTIHIGKWHLGEHERYWPENHGFDRNIGGWAKGAPNRNQNKGLNGFFTPYGNPRLTDGPEGEYLTERLGREAIAYLRENKNRSFFMNLWFYNVHTPLQAKKEKIEKFEGIPDPRGVHNNAVYAAMIEHVDDAIGEIVAELDRLGLTESTYILFTSDNGGLMGNPDRPITSNHPLREGKGHSYEGGVRVPLIISGPSVPKGLVSSVPVVSHDLFPTINTLANLGAPDNIRQEWCGKDVSPVVLGSGGVERQSILWHYPHYHIEGATPHSAIRMGNFKLYHFYENGAYELYDLGSDIGEQNNLLCSEVARFEELKSELQNRLIETQAQMPVANKDHDPERERARK